MKKNIIEARVIDYNDPAACEAHIKALIKKLKRSEEKLKWRQDYNTRELIENARIVNTLADRVKYWEYKACERVVKDCERTGIEERFIAPIRMIKPRNLKEVGVPLILDKLGFPEADKSEWRFRLYQFAEDHHN